MSKDILDLRPAPLVSRRDVAHPVWTYTRVNPWPSVGLSALFALGAALAWVKGDSDHYSALLVALGWVLALLAWRTFANRKRPRNPAANLAEGVGIAFTGAVLFLIRLAAVVMLILAVVWLLAFAEWLTHLVV